MRAKGMPDCI